MMDEVFSILLVIFFFGISAFCYSRTCRLDKDRCFTIIYKYQRKKSTSFLHRICIITIKDRIIRLSVTFLLVSSFISRSRHLYHQYTSCRKSTSQPTIQWSFSSWDMPKVFSFVIIYSLLLLLFRHQIVTIY